MQQEKEGGGRSREEGTGKQEDSAMWMPSGVKAYMVEKLGLSGKHMLAAFAVYKLVGFALKAGALAGAYKLDPKRLLQAGSRGGLARNSGSGCEGAGQSAFARRLRGRVAEASLELSHNRMLQGASRRLGCDPHRLVLASGLVMVFSGGGLAFTPVSTAITYAIFRPISTRMRDVVAGEMEN